MKMVTELDVLSELFIALHMRGWATEEIEYLAEALFASYKASDIMIALRDAEIYKYGSREYRGWNRIASVYSRGIGFMGIVGAA